MFSEDCCVVEMKFEFIEVGSFKVIVFVGFGFELINFLCGEWFVSKV